MIMSAKRSESMAFHQAPADQRILGDTLLESTTQEASHMSLLQLVDWLAPQHIA